jgi:hypothetical protein
MFRFVLPNPFKQQKFFKKYVDEQLCHEEGPIDRVADTIKTEE